MGSITSATPLQTASNSVTAGTTCTVTISATTTGSLLLVSIVDASNIAINSISDGTNTYNIIDGLTNGLNVRGELWSAENVVSGITSVTVTYGASINGAVIVREYAATGTSLLDQHTVASGANGGTNADTSSGATSATTQANEIVVAWGAVVPGLLGQKTGWGNFSSKSGPSCSTEIEDMVVTSTGAQTGIFTSSIGNTWVTGVATFFYTPPVSSIGSTTILMMGV